MEYITTYESSYEQSLFTYNDTSDIVSTESAYFKTSAVCTSVNDNAESFYNLTVNYRDKATVTIATQSVTTNITISNETDFWTASDSVAATYKSASFSGYGDVSTSYVVGYYTSKYTSTQKVYNDAVDLAVSKALSYNTVYASLWLTRDSYEPYYSTVTSAESVHVTATSFVETYSSSGTSEVWTITDVIPMTTSETILSESWKVFETLSTSSTIVFNSTFYSFTSSYLSQCTSRNIYDTVRDSTTVKSMNYRSSLTRYESSITESTFSNSQSSSTISSSLDLQTESAYIDVTIESLSSRTAIDTSYSSRVSTTWMDVSYVQFSDIVNKNYLSSQFIGYNNALNNKTSSIASLTNLSTLETLSSMTDLQTLSSLASLTTMQSLSNLESLNSLSSLSSLTSQTVTINIYTGTIDWS